MGYMAAALGVIALASFACGAVAPDIGRESGFNGGAWRGVFTTKNVLGEMMLLAAVVFALLASRRGRVRAISMVGFVLAIVLIALSRATAALLIVPTLFVTVSFALVVRRSRAAPALVLCSFLALGAVASIAVSAHDSVLSKVGKDPTLTGRTVLWQAVARRIGERPLLGYGYGAFWEPTSAAGEKLRAAVGWEAPHSHNGILDFWLDLGLTGVLCLVAAYALAFRRAWVGLRACITMDGVWAITFLAMILLGNMTESSIYQSPFFWTTFVAVASTPHLSGSRREDRVRMRGTPVDGTPDNNGRS